MTYSTVIVEIASNQNRDLTVYLGANRARTISAILNKSTDVAYVTNCKKIYDEIGFNLLPVASNNVFFSELDTTQTFTLFENKEVNEVIASANSVRINALGLFDRVSRTKLIGNAMWAQNMNLALLQTQLLVAQKSMQVLVYPNGVHNSVISTLSNEYMSKNIEPTITVATDQSQATAKYLSLAKKYGLNYTDIANNLTVHKQQLREINLSKFDRVYIEFGKGYSQEDYAFVANHSENIQQLFIYNHGRLHGFSSSDVQFSGVIDDNIFSRVEPLETVSAYESSTFGSASISSNPLV